MGEAAPSTRWCLSRHHGVICTRPVGQAGLHNRTGTSVLWSDRGVDPAQCPGSGDPAVAAARLADGFPDGRALCPVCLAFVRLTAEGTLWNHESFRGGGSDAEAQRRAEWFNANGWGAPEAEGSGL